MAFVFTAFRPKFSLPPAAKLTPVPNYPFAVDFNPNGHNTSEKGPFLRGWETWVDRNVSRYIRPEQDTVLTGAKFEMQLQ